MLRPTPVPHIIWERKRAPGRDHLSIFSVWLVEGPLSGSSTRYRYLASRGKLPPATCEVSEHESSSRSSGWTTTYADLHCSDSLLLGFHNLGVSWPPAAGGVSSCNWDGSEAQYCCNTASRPNGPTSTGCHALRWMGTNSAFGTLRQCLRPLVTAAIRNTSECRLYKMSWPPIHRMRVSMLGL